jgi:hypothetical protein
VKAGEIKFIPFFETGAKICLISLIKKNSKVCYKAKPQLGKNNTPILAA